MAILLGSHLLDALLDVTYAMLLTRTLIPVLESDVEATIRSSGRSSRTCHLTIYTYLVDALNDVVINRVEEFLCSVECGTILRSYVHIDSTQVLTWNETCLGCSHIVVEQTTCCTEQDKADPAMTQEECNTSQVLSTNSLERAIHSHTDTT